MVDKETHQANGEHRGDKEEEHNVEPPHATLQFSLPELQEVGQRGEGHVEAEGQSIAQEQNEEFVVAEANTIPHL